MQLTDFECPNCGANDMVQGPEHRLVCTFCGTSFGEVTRICPECGHYNEAGWRHCAECGTLLVRDCPACGTDNWVMAEHCVQCGRNLDIIEQMARRWQKTTQQRLYDQMGSMATLKEEEERASRDRMAALLEAERVRQEALTLARESQRVRERQMYALIVAVVVVFVIIVLVTLLLTVGRS
jgi:hypothetical protein